MKLLKINDNSRYKKIVFSKIESLTGKIADKTLGQLERDGEFVFPETLKNAQDITREQMLIQSVDDTYRSGNVMGFIGSGDERLIVKSRFDGEYNDYFFHYLLYRTIDFPNILNLKSDANQNNRPFNFHCRNGRQRRCRISGWFFRY